MGRSCGICLSLSKEEFFFWWCMFSEWKGSFVFSESYCLYVFVNLFFNYMRNVLFCFRYLLC